MVERRKNASQEYLVRRAIIFLFCLGFLAVPAGFGGQATAKDITIVAILPFTVHSAENLEYLRQGIWDMLASRIAVENKIEVVSRDRILEALRVLEGREMTIGEAASIGRTMNADYVVWGSITKIGSSLSLDGKLIDVAAGKSVLDAFSQSPTLDEVIPKITEFAQKIDRQILGIAALPPLTSAPVTVAPEAAQPSREAEIITEMKAGKKGTFTAAINPDFITGLQPVDRRHFWMSQKYQTEFRGMDIGDVNGDGLNETVVIERTTLTIYQRKSNDFNQIYQLKGKNYDSYLAVDVADINKNGVAEIFVTSIVNRQLDSFVVEFREGKFNIIAKNLRVFFRVLEMPMGDSLLIGQSIGLNKPFDTPIYRYVWQNGTYVEGERMPIPQGLSVYGLAITTLGGEAERLVVLNEYDYICIYEPTKKPLDKLNVFGGSKEFLWKSDDVFGGSNISFEINPATWGNRTDKERVAYVNLRILSCDTNGDGKREIMIVKNGSATGRFTKSAKLFTTSEVYDLEWDGLGMIENWRTRKIEGAVADYQFKDIDNDGQKEIVMALVLSEGAAVRSRSVIVAYKMTTPAVTQSN